MADDDIQAEPPHEQPRRRPVRSRDEDYDDEDHPRRAEGVETLIPYKNPQGLIAYYLGVFSLIPCLGLLLGPAALVLGVMGLRYSRRHSRAGGGGHAITGIVLGSLTTLLNVGILLFALIGSFLLSR